MKPQQYKAYTIETLSQSSSPEMRAIADALERGTDSHPHDVDYFGLDGQTQEPASLPKTAVEAATQKAAGRFSVQTVLFPRK